MTKRNEFSKTDLDERKIDIFLIDFPTFPPNLIISNIKK